MQSVAISTLASERSFASCCMARRRKLGISKLGWRELGVAKLGRRKLGMGMGGATAMAVGAGGAAMAVVAVMAMQQHSKPNTKQRAERSNASRRWRS